MLPGDGVEADDAGELTGFGFVECDGSAVVADGGVFAGGGEGEVADGDGGAEELALKGEGGWEREVADVGIVVHAVEGDVGFGVADEVVAEVGVEVEAEGAALEVP